MATKPTLLEIVQTILNDMDADFVNSIDDTEEAQQVASIVKTTYNAMMSNRNWPHTARTFTLSSSGDNLFPTHMTIDEDIKELISVYYDKHRLGQTRINFQEVKWLDGDDFLRYINQRNSDDDNIMTVIDPTGVRLLIKNDQAPKYFTSFDETNIIFDAYDSAVDTTLQSSKTQARAYTIPDFDVTDGFIADLPQEAFAAFIAEATSKCQAKLRQFADTKAEQEAVRQQRWNSRKAWRVHAPNIYVENYGRRNRRGDIRDPTFKDRNN